MSIARSVADGLRDHVALELEAIDRMYLNVYVPTLQTVGAVVGYLRVHRGQRFASTTAVMPMTETFVRNIEQFVNDEGIDLVAFAKGQRKDDVTQKYLRSFGKSEGVLYVGKAQEKARVMRTERRRSRNTGGTYPWIVESTAMVNDYYFYCVDEDFGPFFLKFCSYFPYNAKLCINGHEYLKRQLKAVEKRSAVRRKSDMSKLADGFEVAVSEIIETVSSAATELEASAGTLSSSANRAQKLTVMVGAASEEASTNVQSVASATEELTSSVNEISRQVQESARMANEAVDQARKTNDRVGELLKAGGPYRRRRGTDQYHRRADQSAGAECDHRSRACGRGRSRFCRGGLRGKSTRRADREGDWRNRPADHRYPDSDPGLGELHQGDQRHHRETVRNLIDHCGSRGRTGRPTQEISRNVQQGAQGTQQVSSHITEVQHGAGETGSASSQVLSAAQSLSSDSNRLKLEVGKFLNTVRAA